MAQKSNGNESESQPNLEKENFNMKWPPNALFPLNLPSEKRNVKQEVIKDINSSENYLINTGFSSLGNIIDIFNTEVDMSTINSVRILLGSEPDNRPRKFWKIVDLQKEIKDYWLERGYSLLKGGNIIKTIEYIRTGKLHFKISDNFHAKLYIGESHAISGSSNFSKNGLSQKC
ncbi:MAG: phospholipase D family protein [Nostoc sp.]|uniref:phospholipase D family protein n=1 Tax=Nostoc sp. TaxID=1180 RepID=UPI002FF5D7B1